MRHHLLEWSATSKADERPMHDLQFTKQGAASTNQTSTIVRLFIEHPASVSETYLEHMRFAQGFGSWMVLGGLACLVHAVFPFLFVTTGSRTVRRLHQVLLGCAHRSAQQAQASPASAHNNAGTAH